MAYYVLATELVGMPGAKGLSRYMRTPMGVGLLITDGEITETRGARPEAIEAADTYLQGGLLHEVDEETYELVLAHNSAWAWSE